MAYRDLNKRRATTRERVRRYRLKGVTSAKGVTGVTTPVRPSPISVKTFIETPIRWPNPSLGTGYRVPKSKMGFEPKPSPGVELDADGNPIWD